MQVLYAKQKDSFEAPNHQQDKVHSGYSNNRLMQIFLLNFRIIVPKEMLRREKKNQGKQYMGCKTAKPWVLYLLEQAPTVGQGQTGSANPVV